MFWLSVPHTIVLSLSRSIIVGEYTPCLVNIIPPQRMGCYIQWTWGPGTHGPKLAYT